MWPGRLGPYIRPPFDVGSVAAMKAGPAADSGVPVRPMRDRTRIRRTPMVSLERPTSGRAASRFVGATPGWDRLLVMPQPAARLRRSSSRPKRPYAILDWLYAFRPSYDRFELRSSQLMAYWLAAMLI